MYSIALNTFREIIRSRAFAFIGILAVFTTTLTILAEALSLGEAPLIIPDFCLFFLEISGLMTIIILGNRMISREYEERTIYLTLSRPIRRSAIFFGKYLGFLGILWILVLIEIGVFSGLVMLYDIPWNQLWVWSIIGIILKLVILLGILLSCSVILSHTLAILITLTAYIVGHSGYALLDHGILQSNLWIESWAHILLFVFPNFMSLNTKAVIHLPIASDVSTFMSAYALACVYGIIILIFGSWMFSRQSFEHI